MLRPTNMQLWVITEINKQASLDNYQDKQNNKHGLLIKKTNKQASTITEANKQVCMDKPKKQEWTKQPKRPLQIQTKKQKLTTDKKNKLATRDNYRRQCPNNEKERMNMGDLRTTARPILT